MKRLFVLLFSFLMGCQSTNQTNFKPMQVVENVDVNKYMGKWYEIASIPMVFQKDCVYTTATYSLLSNGDVNVLNECREKTPDGSYKKAEGKAWVVDKNSNAKLKVSFFWPFAGDYWVIDLASDYSYAVVGHPSRDYAWILSRTPVMSDVTYQEILKRMSGQEYDLERLKKTLQPAG